MEEILVNRDVHLQPTTKRQIDTDPKKRSNFSNKDDSNTSFQSESDDSNSTFSPKISEKSNSIPNTNHEKVENFSLTKSITKQMSKLKDKFTSPSVWGGRLRDRTKFT